ncbi:MAG: hypothetical protein COB67_00425 [SAR324 cluster bacterium]|uniref:Uncharacterized protein n=1 Tax=SAR324 cluster bacterium TaxID=2024889 RepID=A0A2A4TC59_9DELT|nr:MAG: hypothetical protein COB67_00425 [SAR324 cluster bacterium]
MQAIYTDNEIKTLIEGDSKMIVMSFARSEDLGKTAINRVLIDFSELLTKVKGKYIPSMDLDHRRYITGLIELTMKSVDEAHKAIVFERIVFPRIF